MRIKQFHIVGLLFTLLTGFLLHFVYEWSGDNPLVGLFSPVNESVWEHLKLLFFPILAYSIVEYFIYGKNYPTSYP